MNIQNLVNEIKSRYRLQQHLGEWCELLALVESKHPKLIVEIGIASGASTLCLSHFTDCIVAIDCCVPKNQDIFSEIKNNCEFHFVPLDSGTQDCMKETLKSLNTREIDLLVIDGDHTYEGAKRDFDNFSKLVREGGMIALHDIVESDHHKMLECHVYKFWKQLKKRYSFVEISKSNFGGFGIISNFTK